MHLASDCRHHRSIRTVHMYSAGASNHQSLWLFSFLNIRQSTKRELLKSKQYLIHNNFNMQTYYAVGRKSNPWTSFHGSTKAQIWWLFLPPKPRLNKYFPFLTKKCFCFWVFLSFIWVSKCFCNLRLLNFHGNIKVTTANQRLVITTTG